MGIFVTPTSIGINEITNKPITILSADVYTLVINSLILCNLTNNTIRINIQRSYPPSSDFSSNAPIPITTYLINGLEIPVNNLSNDQQGTIDIIKYLGSEIFLQPNNSIICSTGGINQIVDCSLDYTVLNDTANYGIIRK